MEAHTNSPHRSKGSLANYGKQIVNHIGAALRRYVEFSLVARAARDIQSLDPGDLRASEGALTVPDGATEVATDVSMAELAEISVTPAAAATTCLNCGAPITGKFCGACGQKDSDIRRPLWSILSDIGIDVLSLDSRLFQTLGPLLFMPGALTKSFWSGRRARYVPPVRLYIASTLFFFLVVSLADVAILRFQMVPKDGAAAREQAAEDVARAREELAEAGVVMPELGDSVAGDVPAGPGITKRQSGGIQFSAGDDKVVTLDDPRGYDLDISMFAPIGEGENTALPSSMVEEALGEIDEQRSDATEQEATALNFFERVLKGFQRATAEPRRLNNALNQTIPWTMIVLLPVFALLLRMFYWGAEGRLVKQLIFSLHFHSYIFLVMALLIIAQTVWGAGISTGVFYAAVPLYLFLGLKVASGQGWFRTAFKFLFISLFYAILLTISVTGTVLWSLAEV